MGVLVYVPRWLMLTKLEADGDDQIQCNQIMIYCTPVGYDQAVWRQNTHRLLYSIYTPLRESRTP